MAKEFYPKKKGGWAYKINNGTIEKYWNEDIDWDIVLNTDCKSTQSGVYVFIHKQNILYIGKTYSLRKRIKKHYTTFSNFEFTDYLSKNWEEVEVFILDSRNSFCVERYYIDLYKPKYNKI